MATQQWISPTYDADNREDARRAYNETMTEWQEALERANGSQTSVEAKIWMNRADRIFEVAQKISQDFKARHQKSVEGDDIEDYELVLIPPEKWFSFSPSDNIRSDLCEHLRKHYPWVIPSEPASHPDSSKI